MDFKKRISSFRIIFLMIMTIVLIGLACKSKKTAKSEFCSAEDFKLMTKIDIHCHISVERHAFMDQALEYNFRILTINTDATEDLKQSIDEQERMAILQRDAFPGHLAYLATFSMYGWDNDDWQQKTIQHLGKSFAKGAIGVKVWKNIGMVARDKNGKFIMIDDPKFDPIFDYLEKNGLPVCGHIGEPKNCWLPLAEMTVNNDRQYYALHPHNSSFYCNS